MIHEIELLSHIHQNADMGQDSIRHLIDKADDPNFLNSLNTQMRQYEKACEISGQMMSARGAEPKDARPVSKMMSHLSSDLKTLTGNSTSKMAEMMIQGSTMGITKLSKQINAYDGRNQEVLSFAESQLKTEEQNIDVMKRFL